MLLASPVPLLFSVMEFVIGRDDTVQLHRHTEALVSPLLSTSVGSDVPVPVSMNSTVPAAASRTLTVRSRTDVGAVSDEQP